MVVTQRGKALMGPWTRRQEGSEYGQFGVSCFFEEVVVSKLSKSDERSLRDLMEVMRTKGARRVGQDRRGGES